MPGSKPGERRGGRKKGTPNRKTMAVRARLDAAVASARMTPLEFMLSLMEDEDQPLAFRADMAKSSAPYIHARKVDHGEDRPANNTTVIIGGITDADRIEAVRQLLGKDRK